MSKGHKRRPRSPLVTPDELSSRWDAALPRRPIPRCAKCGRTHTPACEMTATEAVDLIQRIAITGRTEG